MEFVNGYATLDGLLKATETYDFAAFLLTADDEIASRAGSGPVPRDNVIFEYGLFLGRLRQGRVLAFAQRGARLPSDVAGIQMERFDAPMDAHERVATASVLAGIVGAAIDRTPDWWDLHLGDVVRGWSMDPAKASFSVRLSRRALDIRATTFMGRQLVLVIRAQDDVTGAMADRQIALSPPRRYSSLDESIRLVAESPSIIGGAAEGATIEGRVFVVPERFAAAASIEEVIAHGGRLVAGVTRSVQKNHAKSIPHHH